MTRRTGTRADAPSSVTHRADYVTKRPIFMLVSSAIRSSNLVQVFGFADDYSFGAGFDQANKHLINLVH